MERLIEITDKVMDGITKPVIVAFAILLVIQVVRIFI